MGMVVKFRRHARLSAPTKPKTAGEGRLPVLSKVSDTAKNNSAGMRPRAFQLETADGATPANSAAAVVPPKASTTASTVSITSIPHHYSRAVNKSSVHVAAIEKACEFTIIAGMQSKKEIGNRLEATRKALDISAAELCRQAGIQPNAWSQYESGKRMITISQAVKLYTAFGVTLDWVYLGLRAGLAADLRQKLAQAA